MLGWNDIDLTNVRNAISGILVERGVIVLISSLCRYEKVGFKSENSGRAIRFGAYSKKQTCSGA